MAKIIKAEIKDKAELEKLFIKEISNIDERLEIIDKQTKLKRSGEIDLLAIDGRRRLVLIEISQDNEEFLLSKALDHFDWIISNEEIVTKMFLADKIDLTLVPRIIMLAARFSEAFKRRLLYLKPMQIYLYEYRCIETDGAKRLLLERVEIDSGEREEPPSLQTKKSVEEHIRSIADETVRTICRRAKDEILKLSDKIKVETSLGYIQFKIGQQELASIYPIKNFFWLDAGGSKWNGVKVKDQDSFISAFNNVKSSFLEISDTDSSTTTAKESELLKEAPLISEEIAEFHKNHR